MPVPLFALVNIVAHPQPRACICGKGNKWQKVKPHLRMKLSALSSLFLPTTSRLHTCVYVANALCQAELTITNGYERKRPVPGANVISTERVTRTVREARGNELLARFRKRK